MMAEKVILHNIQTAWSSEADCESKARAIDFLNQLRTNPAQAYSPCLLIFTQVPFLPPVARHFALEILNNAVKARLLSHEGLERIRDDLMRYIKSVYACPGPEQIDNAHIVNKMTQTLACLFTALYSRSWVSFFEDFRSLIDKDNMTAIELYLRVLGSVHEEVADVLISRSSEESRRNAELKDLIRARDAGSISAVLQGILDGWQQWDPLLVELCLKTVARWVGWIDIALVANKGMLQNLSVMAGCRGMVSSQTPDGRVRDAAINTFTETVSKKMKASEKIQLILFLDLANVIDLLVTSPCLMDQSVSTYDNDLAESVARLVNTTMTEVVRVLDGDSDADGSKAEANRLFVVFVPYMLRFFSDEYDEICSTVIPSLTDTLSLFRKMVRAKRELPSEYVSMLPLILRGIISKMQYDSTATWGDGNDDTDEAEFQELRKRLHVLQQQVAMIDEQLYIDTLYSKIVLILGSYHQPNSGISWRDVELALHEMSLFGELAVKNGGMYARRKPSSIASARLVEMMVIMVESNVALTNELPVILQYMEVCVRYCAFFEHNTMHISKVLEDFVRLMHSIHRKLRLRSWYLFYRFVKSLRQQIGPVSQTVIRAMGDLLTIKAELPDGNDEEEMSSEGNGQPGDVVFDSQLYLFEAVGCMVSPVSVPVEIKVICSREVLHPLFVDLEHSIELAKRRDERSIVQVHHIIEAIGTLARGLSEWAPGASGTKPAEEVSQEFTNAADVILVTLETLSSSIVIRAGARYAFSRLLGVLGSRVLLQLPRWINGLLSQDSTTRDEITTLLRLLGQVIFSFKTEISHILDPLLTPLLQRVFAGLANHPDGTDDEIQLAELRRALLNFLLVILNNDLGAVFVSNSNQATFDSIITVVEHFTRDPSDYLTARLAISVFTRMTAVWGGPDVPYGSGIAPSPAVPGFDSFVLARFSPLSWSVPTVEGFNSKDPQARQVLSELGAMQVELLKKTGDDYIRIVRKELANMKVDQQVLEQYLVALTTKDEKGFKQFFQQFVTGAGS